MDLTGCFNGISIDYKTKRTVLSFSIEEEINGGEEFLDKDQKPLQLRMKITRWKKSRSLDANAYFHVLCDKLRQKLGLSMARQKNLLIAEAGQLMYVKDRAALLVTELPPDIMLEQETIHTKLIKIKEEGDREIYTYRVYRGTHTYDTAEMSKLIDATIEECKLQGIETATPDQLARMEALWEQRREK